VKEQRKRVGKKEVERKDYGNVNLLLLPGENESEKEDRKSVVA